MQDEDKKADDDSEKPAWKPNAEVKTKVAKLQVEESIIEPWSSTEFVGHEKNTSWFFALGIVIIIVTALVYLWTKDIFSSIMVVAIGVIFAVYARHQPRKIMYELTNIGVKIDSRYYHYTEFKSFSVVDEGKIGSIIFTKLKRFAPPASIYYDLNDEDKIIDAVSEFLPHEEKKNDAIDNLMKKVRF
jgi:hypothetical protein